MGAMWECGVCFRGYDEDSRRPLALPCGHTFCKACVLHLQQQRCPECNRCLAGCSHGFPTNIAVLRAVTTSTAPHHKADTAAASASTDQAPLSLPIPMRAGHASLAPDPASSRDACDTTSVPAQGPAQSKPGRTGVLGLLQKLLQPHSSSSSGGGGSSSGGCRDSTVVQQGPPGISSEPMYQGMFLSEWIATLLSSPRGSEQQLRAAEALLNFMQQPSGCLQLLEAGGIHTFSTVLQQLAESNAEGSSSTGTCSSSPARQLAASQDACSALQHMAAAALQQMMQEQRACWRDVVAAGAVPALAALLKRSVNEFAQQAAAAALETLSSTADDHEACAAAFVRAGVIPLAVRLLLSCNPAIQVSVAAMLTNLTVTSEACRTAAREAGGIPAALRALRSTPAGPPFAIVQEWALAFLSVAASTPAGAAEVCQAGGVLQVVRLLRSPSTAVRCNAAQAICALVQNDTLACAEVQSAGGLTALVQLLGSGGNDSRLLSHAVAALGWCMASSSECAHAACSAGVVPVLRQLLSHASDEVRQSAAAALEWAEAALLGSGPHSLCSGEGGSEGEHGLQGACQVPQQQLSERVSDWLKQAQQPIVGM